MGEKDIKQMVSGMSPAAKKDLLDGLVVHILSELNEDVKKDLLRTVVTGQKDNRQLSSMVEYWIKECTDSGVNPTEMSKEVLSAVSQSYELATYSTPELRGLFNDWVQAIEGEIIAFLNERQNVDPAEVAKHFKLTQESAIFVLGKMAREGKISMQASQRRIKWEDSYSKAGHFPRHL